MRQFAPLLLSTMLTIPVAMAAPVAKDAPATKATSSPTVPAEKGVPAADLAAIKSIETALKKLDPNIPIETIKPSPMAGVYMVILKGGHVIYAGPDGKHLIRGDMLEIGEKGLTNLTEEVRNKASAELLKNINKEELIVFSPKGETKGVVYAFTDVDCGYCRKLHQEVAEMNELGIELRYLAFPRGGERSPAYAKMVDAWCAKDRKQALTDLKSGQSIQIDVDSKQKEACKAMIDKQYEIGMQMGVSGTPAMALENGQLIPGYRPAADLARLLEIPPTPAPAPGKTDK